jgi:hypothetical protein
MKEATQSRLTVDDAMAFIRQHGVVLMSAKGSVPSLVEAIVGHAIKGSWWAHPDGKYIYATLSDVTESEEVLVCRLVNGKITLVHRRLWPSLVRLGSRFAPEQLARVRDEHTASGRHASHSAPFPTWVPPAVIEEGSSLSEQEAFAQVGAWLPLPRPPS